MRISIKATHQEALDFYMFHCFNISKHIIISVLFFITSVLCCFFAGVLKITAGGWGFCTIFCPRAWGFALSLCPGGGEFTHSKNSHGWSGLELIDTLRQSDQM